MAEPQPPTIHEGADPEDDPPFPPKSAEDLKTAAALSSLDNRGADDDEDGASAAKSQVDQEALGKAMSRLEVGGKNKGVDGAGGKGKGEEEMVKRRGVKVDQGDVGLLVEELELSKAKATDLLKAHEGDAVKAMRGFVTASA